MRCLLLAVFLVQGCTYLKPPTKDVELEQYQLLHEGQWLDNRVSAERGFCVKANWQSFEVEVPYEHSRNTYTRSEQRWYTPEARISANQEDNWPRTKRIGAVQGGTNEE